LRGLLLHDVVASFLFHLIHPFMMGQKPPSHLYNHHHHSLLVTHCFMSQSSFKKMKERLTIIPLPLNSTKVPLLFSWTLIIRSLWETYLPYSYFFIQ
jgi:hypothetical protein